MTDAQPQRHVDGPPGSRRPRLAVVVACYNYEQFVSRAISSVLDQQTDDVELVVVDDGSTDGSWAVIESLNVRAFRIPNSGQPAACIHGLDQTTAPFVLFLDADDELMPGAIARIIASLDDGVAKLQFPLVRIDASGNVLGGPTPQLAAYREREKIARRVLRHGAYQTSPTSGNVFRRDVCEHARHVDYEAAVDGVILLAAPFMGDIVSLTEPLGRYRVHEHNHSGLGRALEAATIRRDMERHIKRSAHLRRILAAIGSTQTPVDPRRTYYYREMLLTLTVVEGKKPRLRDLLGLVSGVSQQTMSLKNKLALSAIFTAATLVSQRRALALLGFRRQANRPLSQLLNMMFGRLPEPLRAGPTASPNRPA